MHPAVRILAIVPYDGMRQLLLKIMKEFPNVEMDIFVGNMEQGVEIARNNFHIRYDAILSRGGTAHLLRQLSLPVIEIEISLYDILCAMKLSNGIGEKAVMVSYNTDIANGAQLLSHILNIPIDIRMVDALDDLEPTLRALCQESYSTVLCDMTASIIARHLGMNAILITSSADSIRRAIRMACVLCQEQERTRQENAFFREILHGPLSQVAVFTADGTLCFSSMETPPPEFIQMLQKELEETSKEPERRIIRTLNRLTYSIHTRRFFIGESVYYAFYFETKRTPLPSSQSGIRFYSRQEAEKAFYNSIISFPLIHLSIQEQMQQFASGGAPVFIQGELGTGRNETAMRLYMQGPYQNASLVMIHCSLLNEKSWAFLLEHHGSPLLESKCTLYFADMDALTTGQRQQLATALMEMEVCRRNWVLFSCLCNRFGQISTECAAFLNQMNRLQTCLPLRLPPLREVADNIPMLLNLELSQLNTNLQIPILGAEPEAIRLLQEFSWPHNYIQFLRVIDQLTAAGHQMITADDVRQVLRKEHTSAAISPESTAIDLNQTLSEINRQVALQVLQEVGGNHTAAAKRLGISRTTFWRMVKTS